MLRGSTSCGAAVQVPSQCGAGAGVEAWGGAHVVTADASARVVRRRVRAVMTSFCVSFCGVAIPEKQILRALRSGGPSLRALPQAGPSLRALPLAGPSLRALRALRSG